MRTCAPKRARAAARSFRENPLVPAHRASASIRAGSRAENHARRDASAGDRSRQPARQLVKGGALVGHPPSGPSREDSTGHPVSARTQSSADEGASAAPAVSRSGQLTHSRSDACVSAK